MRLKYYFAVLLCSVALLGCDRNKDSATDQPVTGQDVKDKYKDALKTTGDYAVQSKDDFMAAMDKKMKELDAEINDLSQKSANLKNDAKLQADKALAKLREERDAAGQKYDELKQSSQNTWDKSKAAFQAAWNDVENAYTDAKAKFNQPTNTTSPNP
jgi:DNA repair exonuclease SbcCD ATPase subunit